MQRAISKLADVGVNVFQLLGGSLNNAYLMCVLKVGITLGLVAKTPWSMTRYEVI